jgi:hypothetical protein
LIVTCHASDLHVFVVVIANSYQLNVFSRRSPPSMPSRTHLISLVHSPIPTTPINYLLIDNQL